LTEQGLELRPIQLGSAFQLGGDHHMGVATDMIGAVAGR
jgi:hypothetical protein